jgi:uncharacterized alpha-E superfamily protein
MLSRVANSIYWMSRYLERVENTARLIDTQLNMILDLPPMRDDPNAWKPLISITGDEDYFKERYGEATRENVMHFHTFDAKYQNSINFCLTAARENARSVREVIPSEMWEQINRLYITLKGKGASKTAAEQPHKFYTDIKMACHLISGIGYSAMSHGEAWYFLQLGKFLERADKTSRILDVKYFVILPRLDYIGSTLDNVQWTALLKSTSSFEMYRKKFNQISPENIVSFLVFDKEFPRSILYCVQQTEKAIFKIMGTPPGPYKSDLDQEVEKIASKIFRSNANEIMIEGMHNFLDDLQSDLNGLGHKISENFFEVKPVTNLKSFGAQAQ